MKITRDILVEALRMHRAEIVEADEWRPLADHIFELLRAALDGRVNLTERKDLLESELDAWKTLALAFKDMAASQKYLWRKTR